ncbi:MAG: Gfo/Idh/MocA family oxidoreductase [Actinomycetota bacterium]|nr:Gfo/Idh/MocA family oxidoreductase [Actinomycetota bacterium]
MMGRHHVRVLRAVEGVELVAVADLDGDRFAAAAGVPVLQTLEQLLEQQLDLCVVAVPTADHEQAGLTLAGAGIHTLVEKPLAENVEGARRLVEAFEREAVVGCVGHVERYNPALQSLRARLEAGELGNIFQLATRRQGPFPNRVRDIGVVKDLATHDIDLTEWVAGASFASVSARTAHRSGRQHEDLVAATGLLSDGTITNHLVNWLSPIKERVTAVTGERGCFIADTLTADLTLHANAAVPTEWDVISRLRGVSEGDLIRYAIPKPEPLLVELCAFRDVVLGKAADVVTMRQGLQTVAVAEAVIESANKGVTVDIDARG